jgi:single-strand DNA-binding protein
MNSISISGTLGKDSELKFLQDGTPIANFSLADNQSGNKPAIWWNCAIFGKRAESLAPYLLKSSMVTVIGQVSQREYTDKDGVKRTVFDVKADNIMLQGKAPGSPQSTPAPQQRPESSHGKPDPRKNSRPAPNFSDFDDLEPPF